MQDVCPPATEAWIHWFSLGGVLQVPRKTLWCLLLRVLAMAEGPFACLCDSIVCRGNHSCLLRFINHWWSRFAGSKNKNSNFQFRTQAPHSRVPGVNLIVVWLSQWQDNEKVDDAFEELMPCRRGFSLGKSSFQFPMVAALTNNYPLVNIQKAIENGPFTVDLAIKNGDFL